MIYHIAIIDDHLLFLKSLALMLNSFDDFKVTLEATNAVELKEKLKSLEKAPDIFLIDVNMVGEDGIQMAAWLTKNYPTAKLAALSMNDTYKAVFGMIKAGCCSYLLKGMHPTELEKALHEIIDKGFYNAENNNFNFKSMIDAEKYDNSISEKERQFLPLACSELTYKQIANRMGVSERTVDGYRQSLFGKLHVSSRTGLAMEAVRRRLVEL